MNSHKLSTFFLIFALVSACLLRVVGTFGKNTISHDEAISYLIATGHRDEFAQDTTNIWVPASAWKRFVSPQEMFIFKQISLDLAYHDIHPPLYFWLLHIWILIFGSHIWTGPLLNVILAIATTISLFYFGNYVLGNTEEATLGVLIWSLSPAVISISWVTRQYELAALITVIFVWQIIKYSDVSELLNVTGFLFLVGVTLAGMLTVYTFPIVIMNSALLFLVVKLARKHTRRLVMILMALGFAIVLFVLSYPNFYISLTSQQAARQAFNLPYLLFRMGTVLATLIAFFVPFYNYELVTDPNFVFIFLAVGGLLIGITVLLIGHLIYRGFCLSHIQIKNYLFSEQWFQYGSGFPVIFLTCLILGFMILPYLLFITPEHALIGARVSILWPFFTFALVVFSRSSLFRKAIGYFICVLLLFSGTVMTINYVSNQAKINNLLSIINKSENIIADNTAVGVLLPIIWYVPDDKLVFAANPQQLMSSRELLTNITNRTVFISNQTYQAEDHRKEILNLIYNRFLRQGYKMDVLEQGFWEVKMYHIYYIEQ